MKLIEIKNLFDMDTGSPSPLIISGDGELIICFYADSDIDTNQFPEYYEADNRGVIVIRFKHCVFHKFGSPNDETLHGHPYYKLGLSSYSFFELEGSDLIMELKQIDLIHPYYNEESWQKYKHFIITFHDNMFECVSESFELNKKSISTYDSISFLLNKFIKNTEE